MLDIISREHDVDIYNYIMVNNEKGLLGIPDIVVRALNATGTWNCNKTIGLILYHETIAKLSHKTTAKLSHKTIAKLSHKTIAKLFNKTREKL